MSADYYILLFSFVHFVESNAISDVAADVIYIIVYYRNEVCSIRFPRDRRVRLIKEYL